VSVAGPVVAADAPPANDKDMPATPNTGTALLRRFRFEASFVCDIAEFSIPELLWSTPRSSYHRSRDENRRNAAKIYEKEVRQ